MPINPDQIIYVPSEADDVRPFGSSQAPLPGPFAYKVKIGPGEPGANGPTLTLSRNEKKPMATLKLTVTAVGQGAPAEVVGRSVTHNEFLPAGSNFDQKNKAGGQNRVAAGKIMALFRAAGMPEETIKKLLTSPNRQVKAGPIISALAKLNNREIVVYYEPSFEGSAGKYAAIQYITPDLAEDAMSGAFVPQSQQAKKKSGGGGGGGGGNGGSGDTSGDGGEFDDSSLFGGGDDTGAGGDDTSGADWS